MGITPQKKRDKRAAASPEEREAEAKRSRLRRQQPGHAEARKERRVQIFDAATAGDPAANAALDGGARRAREYREREKEAAASPSHERHASVTVKLQRQTERRQSQRQTQTEANQLERQRAREQRENDIASALLQVKRCKREYAECEEACSRTPRCLLNPTDKLLRLLDASSLPEHRKRRSLVMRTKQQAAAKALERAPKAHDCRGLKPCSVAVAAGAACPRFDAESASRDAAWALLCAKQQLQDARQRLLSQAGEQEHVWHCSVAGEGCIKPSEDSRGPRPNETLYVGVCLACERPRRQWGFCACFECIIASNYSVHCPNHDEVRTMRDHAELYGNRPVFSRNDARNKFQW